MGDPRAQRPAMSAYGVDTDAWQPLDWSWARSRVEPARNYWLVTVSETGRPHSLPVWGVWNDEAARFCFSCAPTARKVRNLAANAGVVVMTESTIECLSIEGTATLVTLDASLEDWITQFVDKYRAMGSDLGAPFLRRNLLFEVTPTRAFAVIERDDEFSTRATKWVF